jgi:hypothetical protein
MDNDEACQFNPALYIPDLDLIVGIGGENAFPVRAPADAPGRVLASNGQRFSAGEAGPDNLQTICRLWPKQLVEK